MTWEFIVYPLKGLANTRQSGTDSIEIMVRQGGAIASDDEKHELRVHCEKIAQISSTPRIMRNAFDKKR